MKLSELPSGLADHLLQTNLKVPKARIYVYANAKLVTTGSFNPTSNTPYRYFNLGGAPTDVGTVSSIERSSSLDSDAATCTITINNVGVEGGLFKSGFYTPDYGSTAYSRRVWGQATTIWKDVFRPNTLIETYEGYEGYTLVKTGVWLIDTVEISNPPARISLTCKDLAKLLLVQTIYPPLMPVEYYPLRFCSIAEKAKDKTKKDNKNWIPISDMSEVVKCIFKLCGFSNWNIETCGFVPDVIDGLDNMMAIDIINKVKESVGYQFYVDRNGVPHFESNKVLKLTADNKLVNLQPYYTIGDDRWLISTKRTLQDINSRSVVVVRGKQSFVGEEIENKIKTQTVTAFLSKSNYTPYQIYDGIFSRLMFAVDEYLWKGRASQKYITTPWSDVVPYYPASQHYVTIMINGRAVIALIPEKARLATSSQFNHFYGVRAFTCILAFQYLNKLVKLVNYEGKFYDPIIGWVKYTKVYIPNPAKPGHWDSYTRAMWNKENTYTYEVLPETPTTSTYKLTELEATAGGEFYWNPLKGQVRVAIYSEPLLDTSKKCKTMAKYISLWGSAKDNLRQMTVLGSPLYEINDVFSMRERVSSDEELLIISGVNSKIDLESGEYMCEISAFGAGVVW